jgi:quercetin dioxygenase-like cupin family protein
MEIERETPSTKGPEQMFTGDVWIDTVARAQAPTVANVAAVHFTPGARTAWHSHAKGQTLYVLQGRGWVQSRGGDLVGIRPGDVIRTPADDWHWHGAAHDHAMTHLSITEGEASWGDHVTAEEYPRQG